MKIERSSVILVISSMIFLMSGAYQLLSFTTTQRRNYHDIERVEKMSLPKEETSFLHEHILTIMIIVGVIGTIGLCATTYWMQEPQLNDYRNGILQGVEKPNPSCSWLQLVVSVDDNGLWSLDPLENQIHQLAQDKLDKGECSK